MSERRRPYPFDEIEPRWQRRWDEEGTFVVKNPGEEGFDGTRPKYYVLDMFPYPSGSGLHVGHTEGYTATDILSRMKRKQGYNVLHPMGWDAFGLPAEQYAIKTGQHPRVTTEANVKRFREQLKRVGFSYDWSREVNTTDPKYYRWTQWIFRELYGAYFDEESGKARPVAELEARCAGMGEVERRAYVDGRRLAYVAEVPVNWCPELGTVLANEEVIDGKSEVGGFPVERKPMRQWMLRITAYAERLIRELDGLEWPDGIKALQRNWIGRSEGAEVDFGLPGREEKIRVFTTRPDTLFGATYMVLAPEHRLVDVLVAEGQGEAVAAYRKEVGSKSDLERTDLAKGKTGVFTGAYAVNPVNGEEVPIWIADYVLTSYGTGAIMAVPGHDARDFEFAEKFGIAVREVVKAPAGFEGRCFTGEGVAVNSGMLDGLATAEAKRVITAWLEERGCGAGKVNYKLRDWLFARQRYWGEPFPIVWEGGNHRVVEESELPVEAPEMDDFKPTGTPEPPLSKAGDWVRYSATATRELNTMPQWAGSCWYYLRYCDPNNAERPIGEEADRYWMGGGKPGGVDLYVGGTEHAVLHLLYARFWHKVLFDLGHVSTPEPFQRLVNQGIILGENGVKMSKSLGNIVSPDDVIEEFGADSLRLFEMFAGPLEQLKPWSTKGVEGVNRFLARVWRLVMESGDEGVTWEVGGKLADVEVEKGLRKVMHETIKKVAADTEELSFNTAIAQLMVFTNALTQAEERPLAAVVTLLQLLNPYAPHVTEEIYARVREGYAGLPGEMLCAQGWPVHNEEYLVVDEVEMVVQVNGKLRDKITVAADAAQGDVEALALACEKVRPFTEGKTVRKVIVVPGRLVNIVAN